MANPTYSTGTVSVAANGTTVTGVGTIWSGVNAKAGDWIQIGTFQPVQIKDVTDTTHLTLWAAWPNGALSGVAYTIIQDYPARVVGVAAAEDVGDMLAALKTNGFFFFVDVGETAPDPSYGADGQYAFQPSTGAYWLKTGGAWTSIASPYGLQAANALSEIAALGKQADARTNLGAQAALGFTPVQQGTGVGQLANQVKIGWSGSAVKCTVDTADQGIFLLDNGWVAFTPTVTMASGTATASGFYKILNKAVFIVVTISCAATGAIAGLSLPTAAASTTFFLTGRESSRTGHTWTGVVESSIIPVNYANDPSVTAGDTIRFSGFYGIS